MAKYKIDYRCPSCGTEVELRKRVTLTRRRCSHCGTPITPQEIDRQAAEKRRREQRAREQEQEEWERAREQEEEEWERRNTCPFCGFIGLPDVKSTTSTVGWVLFAFLLLSCFPLCFLGLFVTNDSLVCRECGSELE
jgi:DNA-directed RNA polymerase subunit RPC12/RpoP